MDNTVQIIKYCCQTTVIADTAAVFSAVFTGLILAVGWVQLRQFKKNKKAEFTYKVYMDFFNLLNKENNEKIKEWFFGDYDIKKANGEFNKAEYNKIGDILEKFEAVATLKRKNLFDKYVYYDLLSYYIEAVFKMAKNPTANEYIAHVRDEAQKFGIKNPQKIYRDTEDLLIELENWKED